MKITARRLLVVLFSIVCLDRAAASIDELAKNFQEPPNEAKPTVRWWWFGPAVVKDELGHEMELMKAGGFGGFEIQPTYPLALDGDYPGLKNLKFMSPEFLDMLGFAGKRGSELGLRVDLTLGSGWPYGGPMFSRDEAVQSIRDGGIVSISASDTQVSPPQAPGRGRESQNGPIVAALLGPIPGAKSDADRYIKLNIAGGAAQLPADRHGATQVHFIMYAPADLMRVKRAAYGAEGYIVDHYSPAAIQKFIQQIAQPEITAMGKRAPYSIFCDSLEVQGEGWTPNFLAEFSRRRGYDLTLLLPALFDQKFLRAAEIRADYGRTVVEIFNEYFVDTFSALAKKNHTLFRLQAYGTPPTTLTTYAKVDIDEGENYSQRVFSGSRWAASASHLLGRAVTSSEAFTWLHSPVFMASPLDLKAESNLQFLNGINQILFHGWPYTAPGVEYPGWRFYAAGVFNEKNPWWIAMPEVNKYLARMSYILRQGAPANDVALYLPEEDAYTKFTPAALDMAAAGGRGILNGMVGSYIPPILDAGFNYDFVDDGLLASRSEVSAGELRFGDSHYRVVVLPAVARIPIAIYERLKKFAEGGGLLVAVGQVPSIAPGYTATETDNIRVREISAELFAGAAAKAVLVPDTAHLQDLLKNRLTPDVKLTGTVQPEVGFVHRHLGDSELYFVANTSAEPKVLEVALRVRKSPAAWWDATTGRTRPAEIISQGPQGTKIAVQLPPFGSQLLVFGPASANEGKPRAAGTTRMINLSADWNAAFKNASAEADPEPQHYEALVSWTEKPETKFFSGVATYEKTVEVAADFLSPGSEQSLDFGVGVPKSVAGGMQGFRANFQPPIGDVAVVYVNDKKAGAIWCPPYNVDVSGMLHAGTNSIRIQVGNRATNYMADTTHHPLPDYSKLNASELYGGNRFQPQDLARIETTPSGLLGTVQLISTSRQSPRL